MMLRTNIKIAVRNMWKNRFYSFINILGLAIGLATCMIMYSYIKEEVSYDRFHEDGERIFRVNLNFKLGGEEEIMPFTSVNLGPALKENFGEVEEVLRIDAVVREIVGVAYEGQVKTYTESRLMYTDPDFFSFFSFPLIYGDPDSVLADPQSAVVTESTVERYFGSAENLNRFIGKTIVAGPENNSFTIRGIAADAPHNSHLKFNVLLPLNVPGRYDSTLWINNSVNTYVKLRKGLADDQLKVAQLEKEVSEMVVEKINPEFEQIIRTTYEDFLAVGNIWKHEFVPLTNIHLKSGLTEELEPGGNITYVYLFGALAIFVILLACVNFMNLATARSAYRAREVGIRKALGSVKRQLIRQFLLESVMYSLLALLLAFLLADAVLPIFNQIAGTSLPDLLKDWEIIVLSFLFSVLVGLGAGIYPAFYLTHFEPAQVLKAKSPGGYKGGLLRNFLVIFQFSISVTLIICTLIVKQQLDYMRNQSLGFRKENLLVVKNTSMLGERAESFKKRIKSLPGVENASYSSNVPGDIFMNSAGFRLGEKAPEAVLEIVFADEDYLHTLGAEIKKGRSFKQDTAPPDSNAIIINEMAAEFLEGEKVLGQVIDVFTTPDPKYEVIGIMKNFNFSSLQEEIKPLGIILYRHGDLLNIRLRGEIDEGIAAIEGIWKEEMPEAPFEYSFLDQQFDNRYRSEQQMVKVMSMFTFLAIVIACLGLFGLAAFTAEKRSKEIGMRKVLGATVWEIVFLLSRDFSKLVLFSFLIAVPVAYFSMSQWLENFAYKMTIGVGVFLLSGGIAFLIAWFTVAYQSLRAALANPVNSLKEE